MGFRKVINQPGSQGFRESQFKESTVYPAKGEVTTACAAAQQLRSFRKDVRSTTVRGPLAGKSQGHGKPGPIFQAGFLAIS
jgi:hypothetical protein